jgi:ubiquinone biosynthesis protein
LAEYLKAKREPDNKELKQLLAEQKRTNRLLQGLAWGGLGFALGLVLMQVLMRVQMF